MAKKKQPFDCNHVNEAPNICTCSDDCYCKSHTCKDNKSGDMYCGHGFDVPNICDCDENCSCKKHSCKNRPTKSLRSGYDTFSSEPGEFDSRNCTTCGSEMEVRRNVNSATSWVENMAKMSHLHDNFVCPNAGKDWHEQIIALIEYIQKCPSKKISEFAEKELKQIRKTKKATKKVYLF